MDDLNNWRFLEAGGKILMLEDAPLVVRGVGCWSSCNDEARALPPVPVLLAAPAAAMVSIANRVSSFSATLVEIEIRLLDRRVGDGSGSPLEEACWLGGGAVMDSLAVVVPVVRAAFLVPLEATAAAYDCEAAPVGAAACLADADALTLVGLGLPVALGISGRAASGLATPRLNGLATPRVSRTVGRLSLASVPFLVATMLLTKARLLKALCLDEGTRPAEAAAEAEALAKEAA